MFKLFSWYYYKYTTIMEYYYYTTHTSIIEYYTNTSGHKYDILSSQLF